MRSLDRHTLRSLLFFVVITLCGPGCRRYPNQGANTQSEAEQPTQASGQEGRSSDAEEFEDMHAPDDAESASVLDKARDAIKNASASLTESANHSLVATQKTMKKAADMLPPPSQKWACEKNSSPVVFYNAEHNQLVYCHQGNWRNVPRGNSLVQKKTSKTIQRKSPQKAKLYQASGKICGNGKCRPRTADDAPAEEKDEFTCRLTAERAYICRGR